MNINNFLIKPGSKINLAEILTTPPEESPSKEKTAQFLQDNIEVMSSLQNMFYAYNKYSLLLVFQAMDAGGKDGTIKKVMSGLNPQGVQVFSFQQPSKEELDHDYLWRIHNAAPERGRIGIFNRSHYEEVLIVHVHNLVEKQGIPDKFVTDKIWKQRYRQINDFEKHLFENGTIILKFYLHISKDEQKKRFLTRLEDETKNWKFSEDDLAERSYWDKYMKCYEETISATSTDYAPWYVVPFDKKWFGRLVVSEVIVQTMKKIKMSYPSLSDEQLNSLNKLKKKLEEE